MNAWQALPDWLAHEGTLMLVSVAGVRGSTPREAGASMLVSTQHCCDTIGGGRLEWEAIAHARELLLQKPASPSLLRLPLAASLGQCCGGIVWLLFERIEHSEADAWQTRVAALENGCNLSRQCVEGSASEWHIEFASGTDAATAAALDLGADATAGNFRVSATAPWRFHQKISLPQFPVTIFGAGHVGEAIVRALLPLSAQIRWVDTREDVFPAELASTVQCIQTDDPVQEVCTARPGSMLLVLTHSHAIDLELCAEGLQRKDLAFFGLIGSQAKRTRFEQRLLMRGLGAEQLAGMTCPIGIAGIRSKQPAVIAAAVVAQLLLVREDVARPRNTVISPRSDAHLNTKIGLPLC
ncbi:xanthine dehydrogenase accessory protein XdhC [Uliginosibacterium sp. 31-16]|uniref:xanthine dehydrogenase accessory protein XdhC n=1 Tax=Uliginosibacterium sp. 31-16 TaxID=3068315 RepID=UPI00273E4977|nr:xanthine dehydrogenase accessory protein XdhC [Uliginosibacterium sp. 31-16]MDP5238320.1 xanthine dehydrogenase accessory protein XdhC [Uliginosibacterium sp. 31-16]